MFTYFALLTFAFHKYLWCKQHFREPYLHVEAGSTQNRHKTACSLCSLSELPAQDPSLNYACTNMCRYPSLFATFLISLGPLRWPSTWKRYKNACVFRPLLSKTRAFKSTTTTHGPLLNRTSKKLSRVSKAFAGWEAFALQHFAWGCGHSWR